MASSFRSSGVLVGFAGIAGFSIIAGILVAAMVTPAVAVTSQTANNSISLFQDLPDYIALDTQSQQNIIYANRGGQPTPIATIYNQNRQEVAWADVSPYLKQAAVDGEDRRFYSHGGVDFPSVARAIVRNSTTNTTSGSSTLDMQLVKNILVQQALQIDDPTARQKAYNAAIVDTIERKLKEMKLAIGLDQRYSKQDILLAYLNITGFGGNTYGVEAASEEYFSVPAKDVTLAQAASLIAIVQQPNLQNLGDPKLYAANKVRRDEILDAMYELKHITKAQYDEAIATPIASEVKMTAPQNGCLYAADAPFACDYVKRLVPELTSLGADASEREANWANGGYKIYTSIDLDQQDVAQAALAKSAPATETRFALGAAADAVEPGTGRILVMAQNKLYDNSANADPVTSTSINYSTDRAYGGSSGFATGSTYKIFTLTDWLQNGHGLGDTVNGSVRAFNESTFSADECGGPYAGTYTPKNDSAGEGGSMSVLTATQNSVNAAFVGMAQKLDLCDIRDDAEAMGAHRADGASLETYPPAIIGTNEIAPLSMASAIATIGANGTACAPTIVDSIVDPSGKKLDGQAKSCTTAAIAPNIAATVAYALSKVMTAGTGVAGNPKDGTPIVGKTGTTDGAGQNWLIATTTKVALAVWVGNIEGSSALRTTKNPEGYQSLRTITIAGTNGYNTKFNIFRSTMASFDANPTYKGTAFPAADPTLLHGHGVVVPQSVIGESADDATSLLESLQFDVTTGPTVASSLPAGSVVSTNPAAGTSASLGATVTLTLSDGSLATQMPNVIGTTRQNAVSTLTSDGFAATNITYTWVASASSAICKVVSSDPSPGDQTGTDAAVTLTVGNGGATNGPDPGNACP